MRSRSIVKPYTLRQDLQAEREPIMRLSFRYLPLLRYSQRHHDPGIRPCRSVRVKTDAANPVLPL